MNLFVHVTGRTSDFYEENREAWGALAEPGDLHLAIGQEAANQLKKSGVPVEQITVVRPGDSPENGPRFLAASAMALAHVESLTVPPRTIYAPAAFGMLYCLANARRLGFGKADYGLATYGSATARSLAHERQQLFGTFDDLCIEFMEAYVAQFGDEHVGDAPEHRQLPLLQKRAERAKSQIKPDRTPQVDVVVVHYNRSKVIQATLDAYAAQTVSDFAVTVVDDGSEESEFSALKKLVESYDSLDIRLVQKENAYLGAARNHGVSITSGDYIIFNDDDNIPMPDMVDRLVGAIEKTGADIVTSAMSKFEYVGEEGERRSMGDWYFLGGALPAGLFDNALGDANGIYRRSVFDGLSFHEQRGVGHEDYELFVRALLRGRHIECICRPLFHYRKDATSMIHSTVPFQNWQRHLSAFQSEDISDVQSILMEAALTHSLQGPPNRFGKQVRTRLKTAYMRLPPPLRVVARKTFGWL